MAREVPRALVADDDPDMLDAVAAAVETMGFSVTRASTGESLIEAVGNRGPFSLIVTDVAMPWMSGLQVMHSVRYFGVDTPVVVMTGLASNELPSSVLSLGRAVLLKKPFEIDQLASAVAEALGESYAPRMTPS